ncbi:MAG: glycosidase [Herpetosiphonaceae bacterium]|nr:glycosidase [Herpetosiphonaceae bacterium]
MTSMSEVPFALQRLGTIMSPNPADPLEVDGVLNPATCRGRDGTLYLFPRVVAAGNFSRIGRARVRFEHDDPVGVERLGYVLEPTEGFEQNEHTAGVEDPRITYIAAIDTYVMAYAAYGPLGPRIALATSHDTQSWQRIGLAKFAYEPQYRTDFDLYVNKDALLFPEPVTDPQGRLALALIHRPDYHVQWWNPQGLSIQPAGVTEARPAMWISYVPLDAVQADLRNLQLWHHHHLLAVPEQPWEELKIGGGTPPVLTPLGWLTLYHGVAGEILPNVDHQPHVRYCAGAMILDRDDPRKVLYRSPSPILAPDSADEQQGVVDNVVFPTAVDVRANGRIEVYYGMADARIGVARLQVPAALPKVIA